MIKKIFIFILLVALAGCASTPLAKDNELENAKSLHQSILKEQGYPTDNLVRCDWKPWYSHALESSYLYTVPDRKSVV